MAATHTDNGPVKAGYWNSAVEVGVPIGVGSIPSEYFTHLFASFADVNPTTYEVTFPKGFEVQFSTFTQTVQKKNPEVKTLISIGGDYCKAFPSMASHPDTRKSFIDSSIRLARSFDFHGLSLNWLYPSTMEEMTNLGSLLVEWKQAVKQDHDASGNEQLLLVAAVFYRPKYKSLDYPFQAIHDSLDWINVLDYDFYSPFESRNLTGPFAALHNPKRKDSCGEFGISEWLDTKIVPEKQLVLGLPFYGYAWRLTDSGNNNGVFVPADGPADGDYIETSLYPGTILYKHIKYFIEEHPGGIENHNDGYVVDYFSAGNTWIAYNDVKSITTKVQYAKDVKKLRGYYAWHVGGDRHETLSKTAFDSWPIPAGPEPTGAR